MTISNINAGNKALEFIESRIRSRKFRGGCPMTREELQELVVTSNVKADTDALERVITTQITVFSIGWSRQ